MKKILRFTLIFCFGLLLASGAASAQSLQLMCSSDTTITGKLGEVTNLESLGFFKNISSQDITVKVSMEIISMTPGHSVAICWGTSGNCFPPQINNWTAPTSMVIKPNAVNPPYTFFSYYYPKFGEDDIEVKGKGDVRYVFSNAADPNDKVSFIAHYEFTDISSVAVEVEKYTYTLDDAKPNPAIEYVNIDYTVSDGSPDPKIVVYTMNGEVKETFPISYKDKTLKIEAKNYPSGAYIYSLEIAGEPKRTKKFVISK